MKEAYHPELNYIKKELPGLLAKDAVLFGKITGSVLFKKERNFSEDVKDIAKIFDLPVITGIENIPIEDNSPIIIAANHPYIHDQVVSTIFLTKKFAEKRKENGLSGNIHWFIASNAPQRESSRKVDHLKLEALNWILPRFIETYKFIGVPVGQNINRITQRANSILLARKYLKEESGSRVIGIFPEGEIEFDNKLRNFYKGTEQIVKLVNDKNLQILPVGIYRNSLNKLVINFGEAIKTDSIQDNHNLTKQIEESIFDLLNVQADAA